MRYGVILIGIYVMIDTGQTCGQANGMKDVSPIVFYVFCASLFPAFIAVYIFLKYFFMADSFENRKHLQLGCGLMIVSTITQYCGIVAGATI